MGLACRTAVAGSGPRRGRRGVARGSRPIRRWTVETLIRSNCPAISGVSAISPNRARWRAAGSKAGVSRSAQT
jgi:hypothetical protein